MYLVAKVEVLDKLDRGRTITAAAHYYGVNESTIHLFKENQDKTTGSMGPVLHRVQNPCVDISCCESFLEKVDGVLYCLAGR
jgi:hypothetical protein